MKIDRAFLPMTNRYRFDFGACHFHKGFAQIDTKQDAPYYGAWANPVELRVVEFCEGDLTVTQCDSAAEFVEYIRGFATNEWFIGIDGMCSKNIIRSFTSLGLAELLH